MPGAGGGAAAAVRVMSTAGRRDSDTQQTPPHTSFHGNFVAVVALAASLRGAGRWAEAARGAGKRVKGRSHHCIRRDDRESGRLFISSMCFASISSVQTSRLCVEKPNAACSIKTRVRPSLHQDKKSQIGARTRTLIISNRVSSYLLCGLSVFSIQVGTPLRL